jgi:hypothetical protein
MQDPDRSMRQSNPNLREFSIKVPGPFAGVSDLGFTTQYRPQPFSQPMRDVPLVIEGPPPPIHRLAEMLRALAESSDSSYAWTDPILVSDEVVLLAFRDKSLKAVAGGAESLSDYVLNLVRPVVFPFLHDCAAIAHLRLAEVIEMRLTAENETLAAMHLPRNEIVPSNGDRLLWQAAG